MIQTKKIIRKATHIINSKRITLSTVSTRPSQKQTSVTPSLPAGWSEILWSKWQTSFVKVCLSPSRITRRGQSTTIWYSPQIPRTSSRHTFSARRGVDPTSRPHFPSWDSCNSQLTNTTSNGGSSQICYLFADSYSALRRHSHMASKGTSLGISK